MIAHSKPTISAIDRKSIDRVVENGHLAEGQEVRAFEVKLSRYIGARGAVAVNSGTSALHLSLLALGIGKGDEVIVPSFVCTALLNAIFYVGAKPRIADVNTDDFNISATDVKKKINKRTKAIIVPHMFGSPADLNRLLRLGVPIIEDCAQSIGAEYEGRRVGSFGVLSVFSFYATKVMTTGEGGMVISNQQKLLDKVRDAHAYDNAAAYKLRYNYKMTDMQAALGLSQLLQLPYFIKQRQDIAGIYTKALFDSNLVVPVPAPNRSHIYYRYVVKVPQGQKNLAQKLRSKGIDALPPVFKPLHRYLGYAPCPVADQLMRQCLSIPIYPSLTKSQAQTIAQRMK